MVIFFFASRRRNTRWPRNWSSDVCSSDLQVRVAVEPQLGAPLRSRGMAASLDQRGADTPARMCPSHRALVQIRSEERRVGKERGGRQMKTEAKLSNGRERNEIRRSSYKEE